MEIIRKPQQTATEVISMRVTAGMKQRHAKAREIAQKQGIDITAMVTNALGEVFDAITQRSSKVASIS